LLEAKIRQRILGAKLFFFFQNEVLADIFFCLFGGLPFCFRFLTKVSGKGVRSLLFRPSSPLIKSVQIFSNTHRQLEILLLANLNLKV